MTLPLELHPTLRAQYEQNPDEVISYGAARHHPETDEVIVPEMRMTARDWLNDTPGCVQRFKDHMAACDAYRDKYHDRFGCMPVPTYLRKQ